jgi:hypothetical protein
LLAAGGIGAAGLVVMFKDKIRGAMSSQIDKVGGQIENFDPNN